MNNFSHVPPGFRFHPTDEELVDYYLRKKVASKRIDLDIIKDVDLYKIEPWDLQELCKIGTDDENEWYFFSHKDKKYPTGTRTNRATKAGFWKATGRDKPIYSQHCLIGMRKTLVFYKGRAPNGQKSDWIMHEYRLEANENGTSQEEGWVVCKVFKKRMPTLMRKVDESSCWYEYDEQVSFMQQELESPSRVSHSHSHPYPHASYPFNCKQDSLELQYNNIIPHDAFLQQLPQLESPKVPQQQHCQQQSMQLLYGNNIDQAVDQLTDWRVLDKFVASQLSHDDQDHASNETSCYSNVAEQTALLANIESTKSETGGQEYAASTSNSSCQIDPWK